MSEAVIYARISEDREGAGLGVARQQSDCEQLAGQLGYEVRRVYADNDITASGKRARPAYQEMLADLAFAPAAVLVWHTDRLHRNNRELEDYIDLVGPLGITTHAFKAGDIDLATASGKMVARILGAVAVHDLEHAVERMVSKKNELAAAGEHSGGCRPVGWVYEHGTKGRLIVQADEAEAIAQASRDVLTGVTVAEIVRRWNADGLAGRTWTRTTVRGVLIRPRNAGLREHRGKIAGPAVWDAIVAPDVWHAVVAMLTDPARRTAPGNRVRHLLSGIARCQFCGGGMTAHTGSRGTARVYACRAAGCGKVARNALRLEEYVTRLTIGRLAMPDTREGLQGRASSAAKASEGTLVLRARLDEAAAAFAAGDIDAGQMTVISRVIAGELAAAEQQQAATARGAVVAALTVGDPEQAWAGLTVGQQRTIIGTLMTVTVGRCRPGRPDPQDPLDTSSVVIGWL